MSYDEDLKTVKIFGAVAIVGSLIFLLGLGLSLKMLVIDKMGKESIYATITKANSESTTVEYTVKNRIYTKEYSASSSTYKEGKKIKIYYSKNRPYDSYIASMQYLILIVPTTGFLLAIIFGLVSLSIYKKLKI